MKLPEPRFEKLYTATYRFGEYYHVGDAGGGFMTITPIAGGSFEGRINGEIMPWGGDFGRVVGKDRNILDVRYAYKTEDGAYIGVSQQGRFIIDLDKIYEIGEGKTGDSPDYYFRQLITFETGDDRYSWLNDIVAFSICGLQNDGTLREEAYQIL